LDDPDPRAKCPLDADEISRVHAGTFVS
jgi:hypothetical protein